jgi:hypothetical protein
MLIMLLLFSGLALAEDMSSEKYCFNSSALLAQKKISAILVPSDTMTVDENCLVIQMRPHRRELIQKYILSSIPGARVAFSSEDLRREPCKLRVEKIKKKLIEKRDLAVGDQSASFADTDSSANQTETMDIQTLKDFELTVDQDQVKGSCRYINQNRYEITLEVRKNLKPIVPIPVTPGTIVVMNQAPPDQETSVFQTMVQLSRGDKIDLGGVIKNTNYEDRVVDVKPEFKLETTDQNSSEKVFLSMQ